MPLPHRRPQPFAVPAEKARRLVAQARDEYCRNMELLRSRMGEDGYASLIALVEKANGILLEEKRNRQNPGDPHDT